MVYWLHEEYLWIFVAPKRAVGLGFDQREPRASLVDLSTEAVEGASLSLEGVDDIHSRHGLSLGVLAVGDSVTDDVLEEHLKIGQLF